MVTQNQQGLENGRIDGNQKYIVFDVNIFTCIVLSKCEILTINKE